MALEKKAFFPKYKIIDTTEAKACLETGSKKLKKNTIGLIVAAIVPIFDAVIASILNKTDKWGDATFAIWIVAAIVAYLVGGGLVSAIMMVLKITYMAFWAGGGMLLGIVFGAAAFCFAGAAALFMPIIIVLFCRSEIKENMSEAEEVLNSSESEMAHLGPSRICSSCGARVQKDVLSCTVCGAKLDNFD